jgi:hypothetical protein
MAAAKLVWTQFLPKVARGGLRGVKGDLGSSAKSAMRGRCRSTGQGALLQTGFPPGSPCGKQRYLGLADEHWGTVEIGPAGCG